jgi:hypothetical protein
MLTSLSHDPGRALMHGAAAISGKIAGLGQIARMRTTPHRLANSGVTSVSTT